MDLPIWFDLRDQGWRFHDKLDYCCKSETRSLGVEIRETIDFLVSSTSSMRRKEMHTVCENEVHTVRKSGNDFGSLSSVPPRYSLTNKPTN
jgi:hypothetical protein